MGVILRGKCGKMREELSRTARSVPPQRAAPNHVADGGHTMATFDVTTPQKQKKGRKKPAPIIGRRFGRLVALSLHHVRGNQRYIECRCDCGNLSIVCSANLSSGATQSCGCLMTEARLRQTHNGIAKKHGLAGTPIYNTWHSMVERCTDPLCAAWRYYGGRGIEVCERWLQFEQFYKDMGERPDGTTLERINVNGNYEPGNCTWATWTEQARNRTNNLWLTFDGREQLLIEWAEELDLPYRVIYKRIYERGWSVDDALTVPYGHDRTGRRNGRG